MDKGIAYELLKKVIDEEITHQDYERVTELASLYYKMKTGDGLTDELRQIVTRETDDEFGQRKTISKSVIPSTLNSTVLPFQKVLRKAPLLREILYESGDKKQELETYINHYWGEMSLEEYLEFAEIEYNYIDPNAFLITEFDPFDATKEKAKPYPFIATSDQAIMFEYKNEILQYLIVKLPIKYIEKDEEKDGFKYTMYLGADTIQLSETGASSDAIEINAKYYNYSEFKPKGKKVPARRIGYLRDAETKYRTFVSVFHPVLLIIEKMMKTDSELDLSTAFTAFPQRFAYVDRCSNRDCNGGKLNDGSVCPNCNGSGHEPLHGGVKDVVTLTMPRDPAMMVSLENLLVYKTPPIDILTFNKDYIAELRKIIHSMMFNAEIFSKTEVTATATEKILETDNMNDTLYSFARNHSATWEFIVADIAEFTDLGKGLTLHHKMPTDFKFKNLVELMTELKTAKDAGASTSTIAAIEDDINELLYADRPSDLKKIQVKSLINPFRGYDEGSVRLLISQGKTTEYNAVLWANLESIFNELELEFPDLYVMNYKVIVEKVKAKTQEYIDQIKAEKPEPVEQVKF